MIDPRAIALCHKFEGCRLTAYLPTPKDRWTIGWGTTFYPDGHAVKDGDTITQKQADAYFATVLGTFADSVRNLTNGGTPGQLGAMTCLAYNIGLANFKKSSVLRRHNAGDFAGAAAAFSMWNKQDGKVLPGLARRRAAEAALYLSEVTL